MRPELLERQHETEERTFYAQDTHEAFTQAGFYRILQPRRFGGYEFDLETYFRVIIEIARGCPSDAGGACASAGRTSCRSPRCTTRRPRRDFFGPDGHFVCASYGAPVGVAQPRDDGYVIGGKFSYASGIPYSTHFMGQTLSASRGPTGPGPHVRHLGRSVTSASTTGTACSGCAAAARTASRSTTPGSPRRTPPARSWSTCPSRAAPWARACTATRCTPGARWASSTASSGAIMVGSAYAALDEYQRIITTRPATWIPTMKRYELVDYQRYLGEAIAEIACAEAAVIQGASSGWSSPVINVEEDRPFTAEDDARLEALQATACRIAWHAVEGILFRTGGSAGARDGQRMQRYWRDMSTYWSHNTPAQRDFLLTGLGRRASGCRSCRPARTRRRASRPARRARRRCRAARPRGRRRRARRGARRGWPSPCSWGKSLAKTSMSRASEHLGQLRGLLRIGRQLGRRGRGAEVAGARTPRASP
jgi:3-hydroxy-9,10-secoandrosta-1,3,5(10)-triene-9,17-dione monooxygenase